MLKTWEWISFFIIAFIVGWVLNKIINPQSRVTRRMIGIFGFLLTIGICSVLSMIFDFILGLQLYGLSEEEIRGVEGQ